MADQPSGRANVCQPCTRDGQPGGAAPSIAFCEDCQEHLCENCRGIHRKIKSLLNHVVRDHAGIQRSSEEKETSGLASCCKNTSCPLEFCTQCCELSCVECIPNQHKSCKGEPVHFPDLARMLPTSTYGAEPELSDEDVQKIKERLNDYKQALQTVISKLRDNINEVKKQKEAGDASFESFRERIDALVKFLVEHLAESVDTITKSAVTKCEKVSGVANVISLLMSNLGRMGQFIEEAKTTGKYPEEFFEATPLVDDFVRKFESEEIKKGNTYTESTRSLDQINRFIETVNSCLKDSDREKDVDWPGRDKNMTLDDDTRKYHVTRAVVTRPVVIVADRYGKVKVFRVSKPGFGVQLPALFK